MATKAKPDEIPLDEYPVMLTSGDLANLLRRSRYTVNQMVTRGDLPAPKKLGNSYLWPREEIKAWLAADCPIRSRWDEMRRVGK